MNIQQNKKQRCVIHVLMFKTAWSSKKTKQNPVRLVDTISISYIYSIHIQYHIRYTRLHYHIYSISYI